MTGAEILLGAPRPEPEMEQRAGGATPSASVPVPMVHLSLMKQAKSILLEGHDCTEDAVTEGFTTHEVGPKDGPAFIPARFRPCPGECLGTGDRCTGDELHRLGANVVEMTALVLDLDHLSEAQVTGVVERLQVLGLKFWVWETHSHNPPADCRIRVAIPFDRPLSIPSEAQWSQHAWPTLLRFLDLNGIATPDAACKDPARLYYLPRKPTPESPHKGHAHLGKPLAWSKVLGETLPEVPSPPAPARAEPSPDSPRIDSARIGAEMEAIAQRWEAGAYLEHVTNILAGRPAALPTDQRKPGDAGRNEVWTNVTWIAAEAAYAVHGTAAELPAEGIGEMLRASHAATMALEPGQKMTWTEVERLLTGALRKARLIVKAREEAWKAKETKDSAAYEAWQARHQSTPSGPVKGPAATEELHADRLHQARLDLERYRGAAATSTGPKVHFEPAAEWMSREFPKTPWLLHGLLLEKALVAISGEPKTTKTWAGLEFALSIATGTPAFGQFTSGPLRHVAVFLVEDDPRSVRNRLRALAAARNLAPENATARIHVQCRGNLNLQDDGDLCAMIAACRSLPEPPALLVVDPLRDLHQAEENDSGAMADVMGRLRALRDVVGCAVVFVHHSAKTSKEGAGRRDGQKMRGSGAIHGAVDGGFYMTLKDAETTETSWTNAVTVELKAARGAGRFEIALELEDDLDGEAKAATWTFSRPEGKRVTTAEDMKIWNSVLEAVRSHWSATGKAASLATIRKQAGVGMVKAQMVVAALLTTGDLSKGLNGRGYVPSALKTTEPSPRLQDWAQRDGP